MTSHRTTFLAILLLTAAVGSQSVFDSHSAAAQRPGWSPVIFATGQYRQQIKSMPIEQRPNRPFHFYGNAVRRSYYRGGTYPVGAMSRGSYPTVYRSPSHAYSVSRPSTTYISPVVTTQPPVVVYPRTYHW